MGKFLSTYRQRKLFVRTILIAVFVAVQVFIITMWILVPNMAQLHGGNYATPQEFVASFAMMLFAIEAAVVGIALVVAVSLLFSTFIGKVKDWQDSAKRTSV